MQRAIFPIFAGLLAFSGISAAQNPANFSGTWKMDVTRSESAHQDVPIGPVALTIRQTADEFSIDTRRSEAKSSVVTSDTLTFTLDGKEGSMSVKPGQPVKVKAHWDGSKLVAETEREIAGSTVTTMQIFQLSENGKELTINKTLTVQHGYQSPGSARTTGTGKDVFLRTGK